MKDKASYNAGVVGCGRIGSIFDSDEKRKIISSHCGAYNYNKRTKLITVCDVDKKKAIQSKEQWLVNSFYIDYKKMLDKEVIDILSVCTQPEYHEEIINYAVNKNIKAIFCEKPISTNLESAKNIISKCKDNNILLAVNHFRRWDKFFISLKNNLKKNTYGKIEHVNFYYTRGIANTGSHLFDLLRYLFGDVYSIQSISFLDEIENDPTISCILEFENGLFCNLIGLDGRNYRIFEIEIYTSKSKISIDTSNKVKLYEAKPSERSSEFKELYEAGMLNENYNSNQPFVNSINNIIECLDNKLFPNCKGADGFKSLELIIGGIISMKEKRKIRLPLKEDYYNYKIKNG